MTAGPSQTLSLEQAIRLGLGHQTAGRRDEAEAIYRQILAQHPNQPQALALLGVLHHQAGRSAEALESIQRAIAQAPEVAGFHNDLGGVLAAMTRPDDAIAAYRQAVALRPDFAEAQNNLANALMNRGSVAEALVVYERTAALRPDRADVHVNLSAAHLRLGRLDEAAGACDKALSLRPALPEAHNALGNVRFRQGRFDDAIEAYRRAISLDASRASFHSNLASALQAVGRLTESIDSCQQAIALQPGLTVADNNRVYAMHYHPDYDAQAILREQRAWADRHAGPLAREVRPHDNDRSPHRRLRIGYVSPDFRDHALGRYLLPLMRQHDAAGFEIFCYSDVAREDQVTREFRACAAEWRQTSGLSDGELAEQIRRDRIDILVDLTMHMAGTRLLVFARKPAPVQATLGAYPSGTGLPAMDYRFTDPYLDPPGQTDANYVEQSIRLPHTFWCYQPLGEQPAINEPPADARGWITFGCLNHFAKVNEKVLDLWAKTLSAVDRSRLLLLAPVGDARKRTLERMGALGVEPGRIEFVTHQPRLDYLRTYHRIDIGLDTFPYNGHTTSLDSLWMGVPVVTRLGATAVGRAGWSQLSNLNLTELAAADDSSFIQIARGLADDLPRLRALRASLRQRMQASPLTDAQGFARAVESAFRRMWIDGCDFGFPRQAPCELGGSAATSSPRR